MFLNSDENTRWRGANYAPLRAMAVTLLCAVGCIALVACRHEGTPAPFTVISLTLINADTDEPIAGFDPLPDRAELDLAKLPTRRLNIRANTSPADAAGQVRFEIVNNNVSIIEAGPPYSMPGDTKSLFGGKVNYVGGTLPIGTNTLVVTPIVGGRNGSSLTVTFTVKDSIR